MLFDVDWLMTYFPRLGTRKRNKKCAKPRKGTAIWVRHRKATVQLFVSSNRMPWLKSPHTALVGGLALGFEQTYANLNLLSHIGSMYVYIHILKLRVNIGNRPYMDPSSVRTLVHLNSKSLLTWWNIERKNHSVHVFFSSWSRHRIVPELALAPTKS